MALGQKIGRLLRGGEVVELISDLGGGKTVLVRGIAAGLGYPGLISSPTFTISRVYRLPNHLELHHFDFYRLSAGDVAAQQLDEVMGDPGVIVAIEWGGNAGAELPADRLKIELTVTKETERAIAVTATGPRSAKVVKGLSYDSGN